MEFCLPPDKVLNMLDEISRYRALSDWESMTLEALVRRSKKSQGIFFPWTPERDQELLSTTNRAFSDKHGISDSACRNRRLRLMAKVAA